MILKIKNEQFYFLISAIVSKIYNFFNPNKNVKSILVIKWDEIGDMVYALHIFEHLKINYPGIPVTLLCKPFINPLVANHPGINEIINELPKAKFDLIIELRGNWDTLKYALKYLPNIRLERGGVRLKNKLAGAQKHELITNFEIIKSLLPQGVKTLIPKIYSNVDSKNFINKILAENQLAKFAVIHCGARRTLRQWPLQNFANLVTILKSKYNFQIVFVGTKEDEKSINHVIELSKIDSLKFTDNFTLLHLAELLKKAALFIGNESGPLHIAAVLGTPLVGIYGPGVPDVFYPIGQKSRVVHHVLECNPCDQLNCIRPENPCINLVTLKEVEQKILEILNV